MKINKTEIKYFVITIFFVTLALAFDDKMQEFVLSNWLTNFLVVLIFVTIAVLVHYVGHRLMARRYKVEVEHSIWQMSHFYFTNFFSTRLKKSVPIGIILSIFISLGSFGQMFFIAIESFNFKENKRRRVGFRYANLTEYEVALISAAGPLANLFFALLIKLINLPYLNNLIFINLYYSIFHMIPFSELDGSKALFSSPLIYVFSLSLILISLLLLYFYSLTITVILSLLIAIIFTTTFFIVVYGDSS